MFRKCKTCVITIMMAFDLLLVVKMMEHYEHHYILHMYENIACMLEKINIHVITHILIHFNNIKY